MKGPVVIVGSGIVGSATAYHLARLGWSDIVLIDQGDSIENPGSTSHAPGGVVALSHNKLLTQMGTYSSRLYAGLKPFSENRRMVNRHGTLEVAISTERMADLVRLHGESISFGTRADVLTPTQAAEIVPDLNPSAMVGALLVAEGEVVAGADVSGALQRDASLMTPNWQVLGNTEAIDIDVNAGRVRAVMTSNPEHLRLDCEYVVIATNVWAPLLGDRLGVPVPLMGFEHQYIVSPPLPELGRFDPAEPGDEIVWPSIRELDTYLYFRQHWNAFGIGSYRHAPRPVRADQVGRSAIRPFTPDDFAGEPWDKARRLFPFLDNTDFRNYPKQMNGIFAFPVDGMPIVGPSLIEGAWVAAGSWLSHAGGVGKTVAEWMTEGEAEWDLRQMDVNRFHAFQTTPRFIERVCNKNYAEIYDIIHPREPISEPRNVRLTPMHRRHEEMGAVFTTFAGLELPNWFESNDDQMDRYERLIPGRSGWAAMHWSPLQGVEHLATREGVGLFDLSGLSIIEVAGPDALVLVDSLCSNRVDVPWGRVVYTTWLTDRGGVRRDLAVARLGPDRFWMFVGEGTRPRDFDWVRRAAAGHGVAVIDLSDSYTAIGLWGPGARAVLSKVSTANLANEAFPYFSARWIDVGYTRALAIRISYAGELGWELHFPYEFGLQVWDLLLQAGQEQSIIAAGMGAFDSLRLEKGYRGWGTDVYTEYDPYEAGLGWTVKLDKGSFRGSDAVRHLSQTPPQKRLCCLTLDDRQAVALGNEPIMNGDICIGNVTSANFGYSVEKFIVYGYVPPEFATEGTKVEIIYFGERFGATVDSDPLFDPKMIRMKA